jgi:hypothetical protein
VLAAAGCASAAPVLPSPPATSTPQQQAETDAARLLTAFTPPAGAKWEPNSPVPSSSLSSGPQGGSPEDADVVTRTAWWLAPGDPQQLLRWEAAHMGDGYHREGTGQNGPGIYNTFYPVPAVAGLFDERQLTVSAVAAGYGKAAIRVDSLVDWIPARTPGDTVPAAARVAVLAQASASLGGCEFLSYAMPGRRPTGLGKADAGGDLLTEINHVAGLHWKIP